MARLFECTKQATRDSVGQHAQYVESSETWRRGETKRQVRRCVGANTLWQRNHNDESAAGLQSFGGRRRIAPCRYIPISGMDGDDGQRCCRRGRRLKTSSSRDPGAAEGNEKRSEEHTSELQSPVHL